MAAFMEAFITAALVEEVSKMAVLVLFIFMNKYFDEITDGIIYMAIISLNFTCFENVLYSTGNLLTGFIRAFTAVPGHAIWSGIMGYYIGLARMEKNRKTSLFIQGLFGGVLYHGIYDFVLFAGIKEELTTHYSWFVFLIFPILIIGAIHLKALLKKALSQDKENSCCLSI